MGFWRYSTALRPSKEGPIDSSPLQKSSNEIPKYNQARIKLLEKVREQSVTDLKKGGAFVSETGRLHVTHEQVEDVLTVFARTQTHAYCRDFLAQQCRLAHEALASVPRNGNVVSARAIDDMETLVRFVEEIAH